jgi:hypothetical protein
MNEAIWDRKTGKQIGWVADSRDVFSCATEQKIATVRDGNLYSLTGEPLNLSLELLEGGAPRGVSPERQADAVARFKKLAGGDAS